MRRQYDLRWLLPAATALAALPASATTYFTVEQVQQKLFPGQRLTAVATTLGKPDIERIQKASGVRVRDANVRAWQASGGGWLYIDQVFGKHEFITYAVAVDATGAVSGVEIMDYRETYGDQVRNERWRAQFHGKRAGAPLKLGVDIVNLSGATLSCAHVTDGVRRILATHAALAAHR